MKKFIFAMFGLMFAVTSLLSSSSIQTVSAADNLTEIDESAVLVDLSAEEIFTIIAEARGISFEEAKKQILNIEKERYLKEHPRARLASISEKELAARAAGYYKQLEAQNILVHNKQTKALGAIRYGVLVGVSGSGSFIYISEIVPGTEFALATGSGTHSFTIGYKTSRLVDGNRVSFRSTGEAEFIVSKAQGSSFAAKGFSFSGNQGSNVIYRQKVNIDQILKLR